MNGFKVHKLIAFTLATLLTACGGGGGSGGGPDNTQNPGNGGGNGNPPPTVPPTQTTLNAGYEGKLFFDAPYAYVEFDIATGVSRVLRPADGGFWPNANGDEFALVNSSVTDLDASDSREELVFFDRDGARTSRFLVEDGFGATPLISPDRKSVLVEWHSIDLGDAGGVGVPTVFTRDGKILARFTGFDSYTWMPDGSVLLADDDAIYRVPADASQPSEIARFPAGTPRFLRVSPDGARVAFTLGDLDLLKNHVWIMNIDGSDARQVTTSGLNEDVGDFSPDGRYLIVRQGIPYAARRAGIPGGSCESGYIVPLDATGVINLTPQNGNPAPAVKLLSIDGDSGEARTDTCMFSPPAWRNVASRQGVSGTAPQGVGVNHGLTGTLWYEFAGDLKRTTLADGITTALEKIGGTVHVSLDATEIATVDPFSDAAGVSEEELQLFDINGHRTGGFVFSDDFTTPAKLSPDKSTIAVEWHSIDLGDEGGVPVVTLFSRDGSILRRWAGYDGWEWMPDGRLLLVANNEIYSVENVAANTAPRRLAQLPDTIESLVASRDGQQLAFTMNGNVWTTSGDGSNPKRLTDAGELLAGTEFSPDGHYVLTHAQKSPYRTWVIPADGREVPVPGAVNTSALRLQTVLPNGMEDVMTDSVISWR